ncbi:acyltransferase [uncultured Fusobacterium sp.]|uniref:acyltransferase n=1 Tax=uncultured Fusobacterium sp. TaxID=159267 RepID=UPI002804DCB4|nr:acyltransferase [uncultured Fusobacterium sp.]
MNWYLLFLKFRLKFFPRFAGIYDFNKILIFSGIEVGEGTIFYDPNSMSIDRERPWMLKIGKYCKITKGTTILTHDYSRSVLRRVYGEIIGEAGETVIGDNVFIGMNSIILMGSHIGNNVIVGAGSVVSGIIPDNCVVAGNPAKIIRNLDEHYKIRKIKTIVECQEYLKTFLERYNRVPTQKEMGPFFPLFLKRSKKELINQNINLRLNGDNYNEVLEQFLSSKPIYENYEDFIREMKRKINKNN